MKKLTLILVVVFAFAGINSCINVFHETVSGNGHFISQVRSINDAEDIKSLGNFDVTIVYGERPSIKIEADENLIPYIITNNEDGSLVIKTKDHTQLSSDDKIKITVTTQKLKGIHIAGSGNVSAVDTFAGADFLKLDIAGSGDISVNINAPEVDASIEGTGNINIGGQTKDSKISIDGIGDYKAENLKAENVDVNIAGSGDAKVFASNSLTIEIAGSGDVYYHGTPTIHQSIAGSGTIKQLP